MKTKQYHTVWTPRSDMKTKQYHTVWTPRSDIRIVERSMITRNRLSNHYLCSINFQNVLDWELILTRPKQYGLAQGGVAMNSSFQINIYHGTFLENLSYWVLLSICQNLIKHCEILQKKFNQWKNIKLVVL